MYIEERNIEALRLSPNDKRTFDYQKRVALPAVDKLKTRLQAALAAEGVGEIATEILARNLRTVTEVIEQFSARQAVQQDLFAA
jgi:hypothetical protein